MPHGPSAQSAQQGRQLVIAALSQEQIATHVGIGPKTLGQHYGEVLSDAVALVSGQIAMSLARKAISGDVISAIFWLKARAGWTGRPAAAKVDAAPCEPKQRLLDLSTSSLTRTSNVDRSALSEAVRF